jgi:hypothetical protein
MASDSGQAGALSQGVIAQFLLPYFKAWGDDRFGLDWESGDAEMDAVFSDEQMAALMGARLASVLSGEVEIAAAADRGWYQGGRPVPLR